MLSFLLDETIPGEAYLCVPISIFGIGLANVIRAVLIGRRGNGLLTDTCLPAVYLMTPVIPFFFVGFLLLRGAPPDGATALVEEVIRSTADFAGAPGFAWTMALALVWTIAVMGVVEPLARRWAQLPR